MSTSLLSIMAIFMVGHFAGRAGEPQQAAEAFITALSPTLQSIEKIWDTAVSITTNNLMKIDSSDIVPGHWEQLSRIIHQNYDQYDAFVITHGTNTMGYSSAALSFAFENIGKPVLFTGSQIPFGMPGSDALTNLENTVRIAAWPHHHIHGIFVVFGSKIIPGTRAKKYSAFDYDAFDAFGSSAIGKIGQHISIDEKALARHTGYLSQKSKTASSASELIIRSKFDMRIVVLTEFPGMSADFIKQLVATRKVKALILRSYGAGDPGKEIIEALRYLKAFKMPVVITTQAPNGNSSLLMNRPGQLVAEDELAIPAYDMCIEAITTKLGWLLGQQTSFEDIRPRMLEDMRGEIEVQEQ